MMDAEIKRQWVEALRSRKYPQAQGKLSNGVGFCCLGVLCKLRSIRISEDGERAGDSPPDDALQGYTKIWSIIGEENVGREAGYTLSKMNDDGKSFPEIADYIEEHL